VIYIEKWIDKDLDEGNFIEAYAITDQYVETALKLCFPEVFQDFYKKDTNKMSVEVVLRCAVGLNIIDKKLLQIYRDFKSTRDDLIHKSIFNQKKAKQLQNSDKVRELPSKIIEYTEEIFHKRSLHVYLHFLKNPGDNEEMLTDFVLMWYRIWKKQGRDLFKFFDDIKKLAKKKNE
jgi:hypothetical protein